MSNGLVENVYTETLGSVLSADAPLDASDLFVSDTLDFNEEGGLLLIEGTLYGYASTDYENGMIFLTDALVSEYAEGTEVLVYPTATTKYADINLSDEGDSITVEVPHHLDALLEEGVRASEEQESAVVALRGSQWVLESIVGTPATLTTDSISQAVTGALSDGEAPASSPVPSLTGGPGFFVARWDAVLNADLVTYDVHLGTDSDFTPDDTNYILSTTATQTTIRREADETPLEYGVTYYVKVIARDKDGFAPVNTGGSDALQQITGADISVDYIYAGNILADQIIGGDISSDVLVSGSISTANSGARVELNGTGITIYGPDGIPTTSLGTDSNSVFVGDVVAGGLTVKDSMSIRGSNNEVSRGGALVLASGTTSGSTPPTVVSDFESTPLFSKPGDATFVPSNIKSAVWNGTYWVCGYRDSAGYKVYNFDTNYVYVSQAAQTVNISTLNSTTQIANNGFYYTAMTDGKVYRHAIEGPETYEFEDNFNASISTTNWDIDVTDPDTGATNATYSTVTWDASGRAKFTNRIKTLNTGTPYTCALLKKTYFNSQNKTVSWKMTKPTGGSSSYSLIATGGITNDSGHSAVIQIAGTTLGFSYESSTSETRSGQSSVTYNASTMVHFRITETAGWLYYDTSPDGVVWTNRWSIDHNMTGTEQSSSLFVAVLENYHTTPATSYFDEVRIAAARMALTEAPTRANTTQVPAIGHNGTDVIVAEVTTAGVVSLKVLDAVALNTKATYTGASGGLAGPLAGVLYGNFDFGAPRYVIKAIGSTDWFVYSLSGSTLTYLPNERFAADEGGSRGIAYKDTNFYALGTTGKLYKHTNLKWNDVAGSSRTQSVGYTWYDNDIAGGTHETNISVLNTATIKKRSRVTVTSPTIPTGTGSTDDANSIRVYIGNSPSTLKLQNPNPVTGSRSVVLSVLDQTGAAPPVANDFPGNQPATIKNSDNSLNISGDGNATVKNLTVTGAMSYPAKPYFVRKTAAESRTSTVTMVDDVHLKTTLAPGTYRIEAFLHATGAAAGDIQTGWTFSGTASVYRATVGPAPTTSAAGNTTMRSSTHNLGTAVNYGVDGSATSLINEDLHLEVTVGGVLQLQWSQDVSSTTATTLSIASRMYVTPF